jgi:ubiquinone/menaquinone biosynthesis C-methylase UbiE
MSTEIEQRKTPMTTNVSDWNQVWMEQMAKHKASDGGRDCVAFWSKASTAKIYENSAKATQGPRIVQMLEDLTAAKCLRILDIGAGPGILAVPLAKQAELVTAVEPAAGMIHRLKEIIQAQNISNLSIVEKRWEDVDLESDLQGPYDAVVCSFALGMDDLRAALKKMAAVCSNTVYLYWFAEDVSWNKHYKKLYPLLHGREFSSMPDSCVLMNVIKQMGYAPEATPFSYESNSAFSGLEEAVDFYRVRYNVKTEEQEDILRNYLDKILRTEDEKRILDIRAECLAVRFSVLN